MDLVLQMLSVLGIDAAPSGVEALSRYSEAVIHENQRINVTGAKSLERFIQGPLFDALTLIPVLETTGALVDVGSGGGLPGIPAAILNPRLTMTLVEPRRKRSAFLDAVSTMLGLDVTVRCTQDRELAPGSYDGAVAQAVFAPGMWMKRGLRLVRPGGVVYVLSSEMIPTGNIPRRLSVEQEREFQRPLDGAARFAFRLRKVSGETGSIL